jgi:hypothetical protein
MTCEYPGCANTVRPSMGTKPTRTCAEHSTPAARQKISRLKRGTAKRVPPCCADARELNPRARKCVQHKNDGHKAWDKNRWWMPDAHVAGWLHQQPQVWFPPHEKTDRIDEQNRAQTRKRVPDGVPWWMDTGGANAPGELRGPFKPMKPDPGLAAHWRDKAEARPAKEDVADLGARHVYQGVMEHDSPTPFAYRPEDASDQCAECPLFKHLHGLAA